MKSFRCGDVVPGCTRAFTGDEDDILHQVMDHARRDHGLSEFPEALVTQVRASMATV
jgi:predicted small metal-binding protein